MPDERKYSFDQLQYSLYGSTFSKQENIFRMDQSVVHAILHSVVLQCHLPVDAIACDPVEV